MKKYNKKPTQGEWIKFPDDEEVEIKIRSFSLLDITKLPKDDEIDISQIWNTFNYSTVDWKGIENEDGPLECNEVNKKFVYDYDQEMVSFVLLSAAELRNSVVPAKELKN